MRKIYLFFSNLLFLQIYCQVNIVPNASFESTVSCPNFGAGWSSCANWNNVNWNFGAGMWGTPDYYHPCGQNGAAPPSLFSGTCTAQSGGAFMGLVVYNASYANYREYLATPLLCTMTPGNTYTVSFWLTNGMGIRSPWTIRNFGIHFSNGALSQSGWNLINVVPQCEITSNIANTTWTQYTFTVNPSTAWNYMTIGAFRSDASNNPVISFPNPGGNFSVYANYYLDNISVLAPIGAPAPLSIAPAQNSASICAGGSQTLTASGGLNYVWSTGANGNSVIVTPSITTTYTVYEACSAGTLQGQAQITLTVVNLPTISVIGGTPICAGQSATLSGAGTSSLNIDGVTMSNGIGIVTPTASTVYTATGWQNGNPCSNTATVFVQVVPNPTINISGSSSVCAGSSLQLFASGANSFTWNTGAQSSSLASTPTLTTIYTVTGAINPNDCKSTQSHTVHVMELPNITAIGTSTICSGQNTTLSAVGANSMNISGVISNGTIAIVSPTANIIYTITAWQNGNLCPITLTLPVSVNQNPNLTIAGNTVVCLGNSTNLTALGANSFTWSTGLTTPTINVNPTSSLTLSVTGLDSQTKCSSTTTVFISVTHCTTTRFQEIQYNKLTVFPIPSSQLLYIKALSALTIKSLKLKDIYGNQLKEFANYKDASLTEGENCELNIESIAPGAYFLIIESPDDGAKIFRIIKCN